MRLKIKRGAGISDFATSDRMFKQVKSKWDIEREEAELREIEKIRAAQDQLLQSLELERRKGMYHIHDCTYLASVLGNVIEFMIPDVGGRREVSASIASSTSSPANGWERRVSYDMQTLSIRVRDSYWGGGTAKVWLDAESLYKNATANIQDSADHVIETKAAPHEPSDRRGCIVTIRARILDELDWNYPSKLRRGGMLAPRDEYPTWIAPERPTDEN